MRNVSNVVTQGENMKTETERPIRN
jgi:hypothetical protein